MPDQDLKYQDYQNLENQIKNFTGSSDLKRIGSLSRVAFWTVTTTDQTAEKIEALLNVSHYSLAASLIILDHMRHPK
jgi:hypothetical protein